MATQTTAAASVKACCPLCGQPIAPSTWEGAPAGAHLVSIYRYGTPEGFLLCGQCGLLAAFPEGITLN